MRIKIAILTRSGNNSSSRTSSTGSGTLSCHEWVVRGIVAEISSWGTLRDSSGRINEIHTRSSRSCCEGTFIRWLNARKTTSFQVHNLNWRIGKVRLTSWDDRGSSTAGANVQETLSASDWTSNSGWTSWKEMHGREKIMDQTHDQGFPSRDSSEQWKKRREERKRWGLRASQGSVHSSLPQSIYTLQSTIPLIFLQEPTHYDSAELTVTLCYVENILELVFCLDSQS